MCGQFYTPSVLLPGIESTLTHSTAGWVGSSGRLVILEFRVLNISKYFITPSNIFISCNGGHPIVRIEHINFFFPRTQPFISFLFSNIDISFVRQTTIIGRPMQNLKVKKMCISALWDTMSSL